MTFFESLRLFTPIITLISTFIFLFGTSTKLAAAQNVAGLKFNGTSLQDSSGKRFIVEGVNIELFRDRGCSYITTDQYAKRVEIASKLKSLGINAVRLNYSQSWISEGSNLTQFLDFMQILASQGIYSMPSDHAYTGKSLAGRNSAYPVFQKIIEGSRNRGIEQYLIMNPYNEPGPMSSSEWVSANQDTVNYLRNSMKFNGPIVLDLWSWAAAFDVSAMKSVRTDSNIGFSNHWYPNISIQNVQNAANNSDQVPVLIGELGQINPGSSGLAPEYVVDSLNYIVNTGIQKGHNGVFAWMWSWCDSNNMTNGDYVSLNTYGQIYVNSYYNKVAGGGGPVVTVKPTASPVATQTGCSMKADGDSNCDGVISLTDFAIFAEEFRSFRSPVKPTVFLSDFNGDKSIDLLDFESFREGYKKQTNNT